MPSKNIATILALLLGGLGIHKFYLNKAKQGIWYVLFVWTFIPVFIGFIDFIALAFMSDKKFNTKYCRLAD